MLKTYFIIIQELLYVVSMVLVGIYETQWAIPIWLFLTIVYVVSRVVVIKLTRGKVPTVGKFIFDTSDPNKDVVSIEYDMHPLDIAELDRVTFDVEKRL